MAHLTSTIHLSVNATGVFESPMVVEDGTGKPTASSYCGIDRALFLTRGMTEFDFFNALQPRQQMIGLQAATYYLDTRFRFYGETFTKDQALLWPRTRNYDDRGNLLPGGCVPLQVATACARLAAKWAEDPEALETELDQSGAVKSFSTPGLALSFDPSANIHSALMGTRYPDIELLLQSLGEFKDVEWIETVKQTLVKQGNLNQ